MAVEKWFDDDAGPMVRPYTVTGGRTRPARPDLNMITMVTALSSAEHPAMAPEHQAILDACQSPQSVAEVAAVLGLPLGVIKILLGDLVEQGIVHVQATITESSSKDERIELIERTLRGLRNY